MANDINVNTGLAGIAQRTPAQAQGSERKTPAAEYAAETGTTGDRVSVTSEASRLREIEEQLMAVPEVNDSKVAEIRKAIADGTFEIDPQRIADKLIAFEMGSR